jgi:hypothetical protein
VRRLLVALALTAGITHAHADNDPIARAQLLAKKGHFEEALAIFKGAPPSTEIYCLIALVYRRMQRWSETAHFLHLARKANGREPDFCPDLRQTTMKYLAAGAFTPIELALDPPEATALVSDFAADETVATGEVLWLPFGKHKLTVFAYAYKTAEMPLENQDRAPAPLHVKLEVIPPPQQPTPPAAPPPERTAQLAPPVVVPVEAPRPLPRGAWPWLLSGTVAVGVGVAFHVLAAGTRDDASQLPPGAAFDDKLSTFQTQRVVAIACYGVGAVALGIGIYLQVRPRRHIAVAVAPLPSGAGATVTWELP